MPSIQDILDEHNIPHAGAGHHHGRTGWVQVDCPFCGGGDGKFHLGISLHTGAASCWRCGRKNTAQVLALLTGQQHKAMRERLDNAAMVAAPIRKTGQLALPRGRGALLPGHIRYLHDRGFDAAHVANTWAVQGIGQVGRLPWRLFIPVHYHGETVSWTTRSIKPHERQRYISASAEEEAIPHKSLLYGTDYARHAIVVHEGPMDVWATGPGAVATCGTAYTDAQVKRISKYPIRVVCFDADNDAQARARELADTLSAYPGATHNVKLETGDDAADANPGEIQELRKTFLE